MQIVFSMSHSWVLDNVQKCKLMMCIYEHEIPVITKTTTTCLKHVHNKQSQLHSSQSVLNIETTIQIFNSNHTDACRPCQDDGQLVEQVRRR